jgi:hypothetical protein
MLASNNLAMTDIEVEKSVSLIRQCLEQLGQIGPENPRALKYRLQTQIDTEANKLASEFRRKRGWILANGEFTIEALANRSPHNGIGHHKTTLLGQHSELFDHFCCYREGNRPYRAAGVAAHLYNNSCDQPGNLHDLVSRLGLTLTWPTDFSSWWYPGWTALAFLSPAD